MEAEQKPDGNSNDPAPQSAAQDAALETPTDDKEIEAKAQAEAAEGAAKGGKVGGRPPKKGLLKKFNVYLLLFIFILIIGGVVSIASYLNSKKPISLPELANQQLTPDTLKQLANSDATVGDTGQTLTVQGNAVFAGQVLVRSNLNVAGTIQLGGALTAPSLTVSGTSNLNDTQINNLQVAGTSTLQGSLTLQKDLNVAGATSLNGPVVASQITVTKLILSGNAELQVPNHIAFTGATPGRTVNQPLLGNGGSASINGSDTTGTISVNSGSSGTQAGCFMTVTFNTPYATTPHVLVSPIGAGAGQMQYYVTRDTKSFSLCTANPAPTGQAFGFDYFITY
jgi:cytoskeletal protein CcmA (bactofilin family)